MVEVRDDKFGFVTVKGNSSEFSDLEDGMTDKVKEVKERDMHEMGEVIKISGVGKDAEIVVNAKGGRQSKSPMAMHLVDPEFLCNWFNEGALVDSDGIITEITSFMKYGNKLNLMSAIFEVHLLNNEGTDENKAIVTIAEVLQEGAAKYKPNNWRLIPQEEHINHALIHYMAYKLGDTQDNHLGHCMCRLMMAYATEKSEGFDYTKYVAKGEN